MPSPANTIVVLGTGGTIAGTAVDASDNVGYAAGQLSIEALVGAIPALARERIQCEQVAQLDSKDMDHETWQRLALRVAFHLGRPEVAGIVVTHGTDTLEETATFLQRVLAPAKPVVLTAAMRPATALQSDGPQNLLDAVRVARVDGARGVVAVLAGRVHAADDVRKVHSYRLDAFGSGDAGPLALIEEGNVRCLRAWPSVGPGALDAIKRPTDRWPRVEIITSHAGADGAQVHALVAQGAAGIVVAGTGNGKLHAAIESALAQAVTAGLRVVRVTRCASGPVIGGDPRWPGAGSLTAAKARVALMLDLMDS